MWYAILALCFPVALVAGPVFPESLAFTKPWLKLLHYKQGRSGVYESQADGEKFFLSTAGKRDPVSELKATLEGFQKPTPLDDSHPQCRFPARLRWLKQQLSLSSLPTPMCTGLEKFRAAVEAKSASLVFSTYYLNNPASAFGHTMLRLNKTDGSRGEKRFELLDNGINFGANVTTDNALMYAFYGLTGLFQGTFARVPYFYKVREYNDFESRDIWEYDLNLSPAQVAMLVDHIWEVGATHFDYYYLTENCSYHINSTLEAAIPELELTEPLPLFVIPGDTIRLIVQTPGLVRAVHFRPSQRTQFRKRIEPLNDRQLDALENVVYRRNPLLAADFSAREKAQILDAAIDYVDLAHFTELVDKPEGEAGGWKQRLLVARAGIGEPSAELKIAAPESERPHVGHRTTRLGIQSGVAKDKGAFTGANFRFALHDLLDPRAGYPEYAQIEFFHGRLRYFFEPSVVDVEDLTIFRVISLSPMTRFQKHFSWKIKVGLSKVRDDSCDYCLAGGFEVGAGVAHQPSPWLTAFLMLDNETAISPRFDTFWTRLGFGPSLGVKVAFGDQLAALLQGAYRYQFPTVARHGFHYGAGLRWGVMENLAVDVSYTRYPRDWEASGGLYYYF